MRKRRWMFFFGLETTRHDDEAEGEEVNTSAIGFHIPIEDDYEGGGLDEGWSAPDREEEPIEGKRRVGFR